MRCTVERFMLTAGCRQCLPHRSRQTGDYFWLFSSRKQGAITCTAWEYRERSGFAEPIKNTTAGVSPLSVSSTLRSHANRSAGRGTLYTIRASFQGLVQVPTSYNRRAWQGVFEGVVRNAALVPGRRER